MMTSFPQISDATLTCFGDCQEAFNRLVRNIDGFVYRRRFDAAWTMEFASDGARAVTGCDPHRFLYHNRSISFFHMIHPEDRQRVIDSIAEAVARHHRFSVRYRINAAFGAPVEVEDRGVGVLGDCEEIDAIEGVITVVREKPTDVRDCATSVGKFLDEFRSHTAAMVLSKSNGQICAINQALVQRYQLSADEVLESGTDLDTLARTLALKDGAAVRSMHRSTAFGLEENHDLPAPDVLKALGAVSVPIASGLGTDGVLTVFPDRIRTGPRL